jgi:peptide/nickel transport system permease protein
MLRFVLRRLGLMVPVLVGLSILLFAWVRALPGDPARSLLGERATPEGLERINQAYGFDQPLLQQYLTYVKALLQGDFGASIQTGQPVLDSFTERFPATLELGVAALLIAIVVGVPLGYLAARNQGRVLDTAVVSGSLLGVVTPVFFLAILLKLVFADKLHWLPTALRQDPRVDATHVTNFYVLDGILTREWDAAWDAMAPSGPAGARAGDDPVGDHRPDHAGVGRGGDA